MFNKNIEFKVLFEGFLIINIIFNFHFIDPLSTSGERCEGGEMEVEGRGGDFEAIRQIEILSILLIQYVIKN